MMTRKCVNPYVEEIEKVLKFLSMGRKKVSVFGFEMGSLLTFRTLALSSE